jgi:hypothetical protein
MTTQLNIADLLFLHAQTIKGPFNPPGTDPLSLIGTRTIDGTQNNLTHTTVIDQYGHQVSTDTFANVDQPFFHFADSNIAAEAGFTSTGIRALSSDPGGTWYRGITYDPVLGATASLINYAPGINV